MGALAGTITMTCYYVRGEIPKDFKTSYIDALRQNKFVDINVDLEHEESMGWVTIADRVPGMRSLRTAVVLDPNTGRARSGYGSSLFRAPVMLTP